MPIRYLLVFLGGGVGSAGRYWLSGLVQKMTASGFPYGTLSVNVLGSLTIGLLMTSLEERFLANPDIRIFLTIGILGGFTTFSSFSFETIALLRDGQFLYGALNVLASVAICLAATYAGTVLGKLL